MTTTQTTLFPEDICAANHGDVPASREAFDTIVPRLPNLQHQVLTYAAARGKGFTVKGIIRDLHLRHQTASARQSELQSQGLIARTDKRRLGCHVMHITDLGKRTLEEWNAKPNPGGNPQDGERVKRVRSAFSPRSSQLPQTPPVDG